MVGWGDVPDNDWGDFRRGVPSAYLVDIQKLTYSDCWYLLIYQQCPMCWFPSIILALKECWWFVLRGHCRQIMMYGDKCHDGAVQFSLFNGTLSKKGHHRCKAPINKVVYIYYSVRDHSEDWAWHYHTWCKSRFRYHLREIDLIVTNQDYTSVLLRYGTWCTVVTGDLLKWRFLTDSDTFVISSQGANFP